MSVGARHGWVDFCACCDQWEFTTTTKSLDDLLQALGSLVWVPFPASWELDAEAQRVPFGLVPHGRDMALTWPPKEWPGTQVKLLQHAGGSQWLQ